MISIRALSRVHSVVRQTSHYVKPSKKGALYLNRLKQYPVHSLIYLDFRLFASRRPLTSWKNAIAWTHSGKRNKEVVGEQRRTKKVRSIRPKFRCQQPRLLFLNLISSHLSVLAHECKRPRRVSVVAGADPKISNSEQDFPRVRVSVGPSTAPTTNIPVGVTEKCLQAHTHTSTKEKRARRATGRELGTERGRATIWCLKTTPIGSRPGKP